MALSKLAFALCCGALAAASPSHPPMAGRSRPQQYRLDPARAAARRGLPLV